jgi:hypothetical protein
MPQNRDLVEGRLSQKSITTTMYIMIRHQNALAMFQASMLMRGIHPLKVDHIEYFQGGDWLS